MENTENVTLLTFMWLISCCSGRGRPFCDTHDYTLCPRSINQQYRAEANLSQPHQVQRGAAVALSRSRSSRLETPVRDKVFVLLVVRIACTRRYNLQVKLVTRRLKEASTWSEGATRPSAD